jgi:hypothetical protein
MRLIADLAAAPLAPTLGCPMHATRVEIANVGGSAVSTATAFRKPSCKLAVLNPPLTT